jgi:predicted nucleic acid-binding protein
MTKVLFDANVLLDFFLERNKKQGEINKIFSLVDQGSITGFITTPTLQICAYYLTISKGVGVAKAVLEMIIMNFQLLEGNRTTILHALNSPQKDIEDAIQYFIAVENEIDAIVTSDLDFIKLSSTSLLICSPSDLLQKLQI